MILLPSSEVTCQPWQEGHVHFVPQKWKLKQKRKCCVCVRAVLCVCVEAADTQQRAQGFNSGDCFWGGIIPHNAGLYQRKPAVTRHARAGFRPFKQPDSAQQRTGGPSGEEGGAGDDTGERSAEETENEGQWMEKCRSRTSLTGGHASNGEACFLTGVPLRRPSCKTD